MQTIPSPIEQADSLNEWAWQLKDSNTKLALQLAQEALQIAQGHDLAMQEATAYKRIGQIHRSLSNSGRALLAYLSALRCFQNLGDRSGEANVLGGIANIFNDQKEYARARQYFRQAIQISLEIDERFNVVQQYNGVGITFEKEKNLDSAFSYYTRAAATAALLEDPEKQQVGLARSWNNIGGLLYAQALPDSAQRYWRKSLAAFQGLGEGYASEMADPMNNIGVAVMEAGNPEDAITTYFRPAIAIAQATEDPIQIRDLLDNLSLAHQQLQQFDSAIYYRNEYLVLHDTLFNQEKSRDLATIETRYQVKEKDAQNALLQSEGQQKTIIILAVSIIALLVAGLAVLLIYLQRRRLKTQQELSRRKQQEDAQRIVELVQNQELHALEALLEGQEQERNRVATELHDGLGSLLATVKLYFNQLDAISPAQAPALEKADHLLDEACQEVRRYSHDLAGLPVVQFGLLKAVRDLASSISGAGKLQVRVFAHQMDERLPLPIERATYKVIQELLTNVIKHAHATQATVQLSRHDDHLNVILEDNGQGMDTQQANPAAGLGLRSIKARLEALGGEFTLDSNPGHGTTALIDIPLKEENHD